MSKLWLSNGKLVMNADGKIAMCDTCPCDDAIPCDTDSIPRTLYATFGGASSFLGTLALTWVSSPGYPGLLGTVSGYWRSTSFTLACDGGIYFELIFGCEPSNRYVHMYFVDGSGGQLVFGDITITSTDPWLIDATAIAGSGLGCPAGPHEVTITELIP